MLVKTYFRVDQFSEIPHTVALTIYPPPLDPRGKLTPWILVMCSVPPSSTVFHDTAWMFSAFASASKAVEPSFGSCQEPTSETNQCTAVNDFVLVRISGAQKTLI